MSLLESVAVLFINLLIAGVGLMLFGDPHAPFLLKLLGTVILGILLIVVEAIAIRMGSIILAARASRAKQ